MSKRKGIKKLMKPDFTINDCANASKPVTRLKKVSETLAGDNSWDQIDVNSLHLEETVDDEGTKRIEFKKNKITQSESCNDERPGVVYPEIVWYYISQYIKPEDVGRFAAINKVTYALTKQSSFWRMLYLRHCRNQPSLPEELRIQNNCRNYGLRSRVIRALYSTYSVLRLRTIKTLIDDGSPHDLVKHRCVDVWYKKAMTYWVVYFKFKKMNVKQRFVSGDYFDELGRIDANPEEDCKVMMVKCHSFNDVPPLMGMTLASVKQPLERGFTQRTLVLGFTSSHHNISREIIPECYVVLNAVIGINICDWWHPMYPYFEVLPLNMKEDESLPGCLADPPVPPIVCGIRPANMVSCIGNPVIVPLAVNKPCLTQLNECSKMSCIFRRAGWLEGTTVDKRKVSEHFTQYANEHPEWAAAVTAVKEKCINKDLPSQGVPLNCPAYDIMFCALTNFIQSAVPSQWSDSPACVQSRQWAAACPQCPDDCFASAVPIGSCNACTLLPRRT